MADPLKHYHADLPPSTKPFRIHKLSLEEKRLLLIECRYHEALHEDCIGKNQSKCKDHLARAKMCYAPIFLPKEWRRYEKCREMKPATADSACAPEADLLEYSYEDFWKRQKAAFDNTEGPCANYYVEFMKCQGIHGRRSPFCNQLETSYKACIDGTLCSKQYSALDQCMLMNGDDPRKCQKQVGYLSDCKVFSGMARDPDFRARGLAHARLAMQGEREAAAQRHREEQIVEADLLPTDTGPL